ncbi:MAG: class I SAM-dependent methyltransferase, partial [bacterium]|nr:class I SAM-dependent methyltransferase [bacterium]
PIDIDLNTSIETRMKKEWNARAKLDTLFVIATDHSKNYDEFWNSGIDNCKNILGMDNSRFEQIIKNKEPSKMQILEIGCGIGRILIPMSKVFGKVIGVDISPEMIQQGQEHVKNISNCMMLECNGTDLSIFPNDSFDFCYSFIVFQHIPDNICCDNTCIRIICMGTIYILLSYMKKY